jgi:hypothetical protein
VPSPYRRVEPRSGNEHNFVLFAGALMFAALGARRALRGKQSVTWAQVWSLAVAIVILAALADLLPQLVVPFTIVLSLSFLFAHDELVAVLQRITGASRAGTGTPIVLPMTVPGFTQAPGQLPLPNLPTP